MAEARPSGEDPVARLVLVSGRVQGVGFRWHTRRRAEELGVQGWVRNEPDGRVAVHVEGASDRVDAMLAWLVRGPGTARVESIEVRSAPLEQRVGFQVERE